MQELDLSDSFRKSIQDKLTDLNIDYSEILLDSIFDENVLKEIPIIKTIHAFAQIGITVRNQFLYKKIYRFLYETDHVSKDEVNSFIHKIENDKNFNQKVYESIVILIDRLDDTEKSTIIGKLFCATMRENIGIDDFFRLSNIVEKLFIEDLKTFNGYYNSNSNQDKKVDCLYKLNKTVKVNLSSYGLLIPVIEENLYEQRNFDSAKRIDIREYKISEFGELLIEHGF